MSIWKNKNWPRFHWSLEALLPLMLEIRRKQGELSARGFSPHENIDQALTQEQLFAWKAQTSLPEKDYRSFAVPTAPQPEYLKAEMNRFLRWFNSEDILKINGVLRAGISHLWFVTIHPFDDGNQRVASLITDLALSQDEKINFRRESLSASILQEKRSYADIMVRTQNGDLEITPWLQWFFNVYLHSLIDCEAKAERNLQTVEYWLRWKDHSLNDRQRRALQALLEFDAEEQQELTNKKYVSLTETSPESAKRDLADLLEKDILIRNPGAGRSTSYSIKSN